VDLAQLTVPGREWLVAVAPLQDGLVMELLRYSEELREPAEYFDEVPAAKPQKEMVDLAVQLVENKSGAFDPNKFEDHYGTALKELVQES
jgi:DNA end-binding protein Ku